MFGARVVHSIFQSLKTSHLQGHLVWIPMLPADNMAAALAQEALFRDERFSQYWDGDRAIGEMVSHVLNLTAPIAWDIYLLYSPGIVRTGNSIIPPNFWMHQLDERPDLLLDPDRLSTEVHKLLELNFPKETFINE